MPFWPELRHFSHRTRIVEARTPHKSCHCCGGANAPLTAVRSAPGRQKRVYLLRRNAPTPLVASLLHLTAFAVTACLCHLQCGYHAGGSQARIPRLVKGKCRVGLIPGTCVTNPCLCPTPTSPPPVPYAAASCGPEHIPCTLRAALSCGPEHLVFGWGALPLKVYRM